MEALSYVKKFSDKVSLTLFMGLKALTLKEFKYLIQCHTF